MFPNVPLARLPPGNRAFLLVKKDTHDFRKKLESIAQSHHLSTVFNSFCRLAACALAAQTREPEYLAEAKRWTKPELTLFAEALGCLTHEMERKPFEDVLGTHYLEFALSQKGQQWNGEFHTPKTICDLMARITFDPATMPAEGPITVCEPACGAGAMILSLGEICAPAVRRRLRVTAIDINATACDMCFINTTLWGIPARVIHGDTIALKFYSAWSNIHYLLPWLPLVKGQRPPAEVVAAQGQPPPPAEVAVIAKTLHQTELFEMA